MTISTAQEANLYALRMFNDDYWDKEYTPIFNQLALVKSQTEDDHYLLPVTLKVSRHCIGDDDSENYLDLYPEGDLPDELRADDQGVITMELVVRIGADLEGFEQKAQTCLDNLECSALGMWVVGVSLATMEPDLILSNDATGHLVTAINKKYMCIDLIREILDFPQKAKKLNHWS